MTTSVGVVIPTLNGGAVLGDLLDALSRQDGGFELEIVGIDSGSTDGSIERLTQAGATVVKVPRGTFNHGRTRNEALSRVRAALAVLLVQDAVPASRAWLSALVRPLLSDSSVAGTFSRQVPRPGASRVTAHYLEQWAAAQIEPRTVGPVTPERFARMTPAERHAACAFDNVCSCVRLSVWRHHPFQTTAIAEDLEWAKDVLLAGHKLAYVPDAVVMHSHDRSIRYELRRTYLVHKRLEALFGLITVPTVGSLMRSIASTIPLNVRVAAGEPDRRTRAMVKGAALGIAQPLGQFLGARAARADRERLPRRGI